VSCGMSRAVGLQVRIYQHDSSSMSLFDLTGYDCSVWRCPHCLFVIEKQNIQTDQFRRFHTVSFSSEAVHQSMML